MTIEPDTIQLAVDSAYVLSVTARGNGGEEVQGVTPSWTSADTTIVRIAPTGEVRGIAPGTTVIEAILGRLRARSTIIVKPSQPVVASVSVTFGSSTIAVGSTTQATAQARDGAGTPVATGTVVWESSDPAVAKVNQNGRVTGVAAGTAIISATTAGKTGRATITVKASAPAPTEPPAPTPPPGTTVAECANPRAGWIWCDDFEQDRLGRYSEYESASGSFARAASVGTDGSTGMRARFTKGQVDAGNLKVAFGRNPVSGFKPVDGGTANYRELYWRVYVRTQPGWTGGAGEKLSRATIMAGSNWQQAMIAHVWGGASPDQNYLTIDPASGTSTSGALQTTQYNDFANLRWLGLQKTATPWFDASRAGQWLCVEAHVKLNDAGQSNGLFELWVNGQREAQRTGLNWVGSYNGYGMNAVFLENWWNGGSPAAQERYFDNLVVSTQPIGCLGSPASPEPPPAPQPPPAPTPAPVAAVAVTPTSATLDVGATRQLSATARDASGTTLSGRTITWSSSNPSIASVSSSGLVTALAAGSARIDATSEGVRGSATITVNAPVMPPTNSACSNAPAGLTMVSDQPWNAVPPDLGRGVDAAGWAVDRGRTNLSVVQDATAPRSPGSVMRGRFPTSLAGGYDPFSIAMNFPARYTTVYQCVWMRHSPNFTDNGNVGTKFAFYRGDGTNHYWAFDGGEDGTDQFFTFFGLQQGAGNRDFRSTFRAKPLGVWRKYEVLAVGNTTGSANGKLRMWVDGQLVLSADDVAYWKSGQTPGWTGIAWEPTYGGGRNSPPQELYMDVDHWTIMGK